MKKYLWLLILLTIVVLVVIFRLKNQPEKPETSPSSSNYITGWKSFNDDNFSFKYPGQWINRGKGFYYETGGKIAELFPGFLTQEEKIDCDQYLTRIRNQISKKTIVKDVAWINLSEWNYLVNEIDAGYEYLFCEEYEEKMFLIDFFDGAYPSGKIDLFREVLASFKFKHDTSGISPDSLKNRCEAKGGYWLEEYRECERIQEVDCESLGGKFESCGSACRHASPEVKQCIMLCVAYCSFEETVSQSSKKQAVYINNVYEKAGKRYLDVVLIEWLSGEAAVKAAIKDTGCPRERITDGDCAPSLNNGYYIRIIDKDNYVFEISSNAVIESLEKKIVEPEKITFTKLKEIFENDDSRRQWLKTAPYEIELNDEIVTYLRQVYRP